MSLVLIAFFVVYYPNQLFSLAGPVAIDAYYGHQFDHALKQIIARHFQPAFQTGEFGAGLYQGTLATIDVLTAGQYEAPPKTQRTLSSISIPWLEITLGIGGIGLVVALIILDRYRANRAARGHWRRKYFSRRKRHADWVTNHHSPGRGGSSGGGRSGGGGASGKW